MNFLMILERSIRNSYLLLEKDKLNFYEKSDLLEL